MATSFIGQRISLLSHSDVRYLGTLDGLDPANATIKLKNVYSMGTESRRPPDEFIGPLQKPYQYIIFQAVEVKDLWLDNSFDPRPPSVHDDPAVIGVGDAGTHVQPEPAAAGPQTVPANLGARPPPQVASSAPQPMVTPSASTGAAGIAVPQGQRVQQQQGEGAGRASVVNRRGNGSVNSVHSVTQSMENIERAIVDLRLQSGQQGQPNGSTRGPRRNGGANGRDGAAVQAAAISIPLTEFDFQSANARFKKSSGRKGDANGANEDDDDSDDKTNPSDEEDIGSKTSSGKATKDEPKSPGAYNPKSSFFDSLSSSAADQAARGGRGRGGRGRGMGRSRREEEREKNVATFGEPGGLGLMGPDAYVGGYGGSNRGRRGGRGGRRGGPRRGNPPTNP